jgi:hypothetical protein
MKQVIIHAYEIGELSPNVRDKVIDRLRYDIMPDDWWDCTYEWAQDQFSEIYHIKGFEVDRRMLEVDWNEISEEDAMIMSRFEIEERRREIKREVLNALESEYDHYTSDEYVIDWIKNNEYLFDVEGNAIGVHYDLNMKAVG